MELELFSVKGLWALFSIIMFDLILSGDNAVVIALASRNLPKHQQKQAIIWGTVGAITIRVICTILVVYLLKIPLLQFFGGLLLLWVAYQLMMEEDQKDQKHDVKAGKTLGQAIRTIILADVLMGFDNVVAIAGASHGSVELILFGLAISIPIMIWGSKLILGFMERYPIIIQIGVAILAWTAGDMILKDDWIEDWISGARLDVIEWILPASLVILILGIGNLIKKRKDIVTR